MPTKRKPASGAGPGKSEGRPSKRAALPVPPLSTMTPAERLAGLLKGAKDRGIGPMSESELARLVEENHAAWPDSEEIDAFIDWLHKARRQGRYD